ncbi:MAG: orotidine-5'-phosphate decarboxylase [Richelia sp. RM2_1_2]|nr:orotidine-5'-phosphate decarboxylase [Richelia sp. RM2_1_2]
MNSPIIVALDTKTVAHANFIINETNKYVWGYKIGPQLLYNNMFSMDLKELINSTENIFVDLKFHDIPNTVGESVASIITLKPKMFTVHAAGGRNMIRAAATARSAVWSQPGTGPKVIVVTILTSFSTYSWLQTFPGLDPSLVVQNFLNESINHGADGVVCSGLEVSYIKSRYPHLITIVPGIRLEPTDDDQARVTTPRQAIDRGATFIVVGRPIVNAEKPSEVVKKILASL